MPITKSLSTAISDGVGNYNFRNRIINGDMRIDQRNSGSSVTGNNDVYPVDRWVIGAAQSSKMTVQRSSVAPPGFTNSILITSSTANSPAASDFFLLDHRLEGLNTADLNLGTANAATVTLSFWVRSSLTGTFSVCLLSGQSTYRSYVATYSINAANTWEQKTITVAMDTTSQASYPTDNTRSLFLRFDLGCGTNFEGSALSWASSLTYRTSTSNRLLNTNGATFYITGVQLEAGSAATPFERRPYGTELALCQRYYCGLYPSRPAWCTTAFVMVPISWPVSMRSTPTIVAPYLDANYTSSGSPTGSQWNIQQVLVAAYTKTGTATITSSSLSAIDNMGFIIITGATFSGTGDFIATSSSMPNITVTAEL